MTEEDIRWRIGRQPYICYEAEAYVTAINILAIEYLIKTQNYEEYHRWIDVIYKLSLEDLDFLQFLLSVNKHTSSLGAMITQGDYDSQRETLMDFLTEMEKNNES